MFRSSGRKVSLLKKMVIMQNMASEFSVFDKQVIVYVYMLHPLEIHVY